MMSLLVDIYQLLKASSICKEDLSLLEEKDKQYVVFKKWKEIQPGKDLIQISIQSNFKSINF